MKTEFVRFLFPLTVLLLAGALEEVLPHAWSVGFPLLMVAALVLGSGQTRTDAVLLAIAAGTAEDALGGLPLATTSSFLVLVALCVRAFASSRFVPILAYPAYQLWLVVWTALPAGALWGRLLVSLPLAAATTFALRPVLLKIEGRMFSDAR